MFVFRLFLPFFFQPLFRLLSSSRVAPYLWSHIVFFSLSDISLIFLSLPVSIFFPYSLHFPSPCSPFLGRGQNERNRTRTPEGSGLSQQRVFFGVRISVCQPSSYILFFMFLCLEIWNFGISHCSLFSVVRGRFGVDVRICGSWLCYLRIEWRRVKWSQTGSSELA